MTIAVEGEVNFIGATSYAVYVGRQNSGSVIFHFLDLSRSSLWFVGYVKESLSVLYSVKHSFFVGLLYTSVLPDQQHVIACHD